MTLNQNDDLVLREPRSLCDEMRKSITSAVDAPVVFFITIIIDTMLAKGVSVFKLKKHASDQQVVVSWKSETDNFSDFNGATFPISLFPSMLRIAKALDGKSFEYKKSIVGVCLLNDEVEFRFART